MYGEASRLLADIRLGRVPTSVSINAFANRQRVQLQHAFQQTRVQQRVRQTYSKDKYDMGACTRTFKIGDTVRIYETKLGTNSKLTPKWSDPYEVVGVRGVNIEVRMKGSDKSIIVHHDKVSNPQRIIRDENLPAHDESYRPDLHSNSNSDGESDEGDRENHHDKTRTGTPENTGTGELSDAGEPENHSGEPENEGDPEPTSTSTQTQTRTSQHTKTSKRNKDYVYYE
jgi:hypothetical protein